MDINKILKPFDNLLKSLNENKIILILILILLGIYYTYYNNNIVENSISLFDNELFKFSLFVLITYISSSNPAIGIALAIIMLVSLQAITYLKIKREFDIDIKKMESEINLDKEKFELIEPADMSYLDDEYLTNPLNKINQLSPPINFNLKFITPNDLSYQMINQGKTLLNSSYDLEHDLENRYDNREQQIVNETKRNGIELVDSGLNRLQNSDQGEYNYSKNLNFDSDTPDKFVKYTKLMDKKNLSNPLINASFNQLLYNYDMLVNKKLNPKDFDLQLEKVYMSEFDLLQNIYKCKKKNYTDEKQKIIENMINEILNLPKQYKNKLFLKLEQLYLTMT
jgi:hypothetical protein